MEYAARAFIRGHWWERECCHVGDPAFSYRGHHRGLRAWRRARLPPRV